MMNTKLLTQQRLRKLMHYDKHTGIFTRLSVPTHQHLKIGDVVGWKSGSGYLYTMIDGITYSLQRLAWLYMTGQWPANETDHINGKRCDNRWSNLREATKSINLQNQRKAQRHNSTGLLGISKNGRGFVARIRLMRKRINLGTYPTPELAHMAYVRAKRHLHAGCTL